MLQEIAPHEFDNQIRFIAPQPDDPVLVYHNPTEVAPYNAILSLSENRGRLSFPRFSDFGGDISVVHAFDIDDKPFFLARPEKTPHAELIIPPGYEFVRLPNLRLSDPQELAFAGMTGYHLHTWYRDNVFCGRCGSTLVDSTYERALTCPACGNVVYPKIAPAVIVAITDGDRIVLEVAKGRMAKHRGLVAGHVEIGETVEETVHREVMEEVGLRVKNLRYYKTQPWGFGTNLLIGFFAELDGDDEIRVDEVELDWAGWVKREDITEEVDHISMTSEMIGAFKNRSLPFL